MANEAFKRWVREHRNEIMPKVQAVYAKHGIVVDNVTNAGANLRFTSGQGGLEDAIAEEAELLAGFFAQATGQTPEPKPEEENEEENEQNDVPPPPPGAGAGKWTGSWSPRTWTGTFVEQE